MTVSKIIILKYIFIDFNSRKIIFLFYIKLPVKIWSFSTKNLQQNIVTSFDSHTLFKKIIFLYLKLTHLTNKEVKK